MLKKNEKLSGWGFESSIVSRHSSFVGMNLTKDDRRKTIDVLIGCLFLIASLGLSGCDRGASEQIQAAQKFADLVVRNNIPARDSMIATRLLKKHFANEFVRSDLISWMGTIYDMRQNKFIGSSRADVDRDLKDDIQSGLISGDEIEETGMVRVKASNPNDPSAYFWMVKQKGHHWAVAMVTKGEMAVNFK